MQTPLLTPDGFPRADIDVAQIRTTRARIVRLRNDHKSLMKEIEPLLHAHFATLAAQTAPSASSANGAESVDGESGDETPFANVRAVSDASPASSAGLRPGDRVVRFGEADWLNHEKLGRVARVVAASEGRSVPVIVVREGAVVRLALTPRRWEGRGLLGCHLVPL